MATFTIQGGASLEGEVHIGGAKNAALKLMAAALATEETLVLRRVPDIRDIRSMQEIIKQLGGQVSFANNVMKITCVNVTKGNPDYQLVKHIRASVAIIGPLLTRFGEVSIPQPGGCLIGARPIDTIVNGLSQFNVECVEKEDYYYFKIKDKQLNGAVITLDEMSVSATETVLMAAVCARGDTEIRLAAAEPEIADLAVCLNHMGARIEGAGTNTIRVRGVKKLHGAEHNVLPDRIEAGTFAIAAAVSRGDVRIRDIAADHLALVLNKFTKANVTFVLEDNNTTLHIQPTTIFNPLTIDTRPYPGFPTDLQAPMSILMTQARGTSTIFETMYDGRLGYARELQKMGADVHEVDAHTLVVKGPTPLYGKHITSFDIRAGATLIIAALIAQGESIIDRVELVDRGYERIDERLNSLGARIKRG